MAKVLGKVTKSGLNTVIEAGMYNTGVKDPFLANVNYLKLSPGNQYVLRILPPVSDPDRFGSVYEAMALCVPTHSGVGNLGKEMIPCANRLASKYSLNCPFCAEFVEHGNAINRAKTKFYYFFNVIVLSTHENVIRGVTKPDGSKKYNIYTIRVPKKSVFIPISNYYKNNQRAIEDISCLVNGCAISITMGEQSYTDKNGRVNKIPQYDSVNICEAQGGDISSLIDIDDIPDLRSIIEFLPSAEAYRQIADGMGIKDAMDMYGKINIFTGEVVKGERFTNNTLVSKANDNSNFVVDAPAVTVDTNEYQDITGSLNIAAPVEIDQSSIQQMPDLQSNNSNIISDPFANDETPL